MLVVKDLASSDCFGECAMNWPASVKSGTQRSNSHMEFFTPLCERLSLLVPYVMDAIASVIALCLGSGPSAIRLRVRAVDVNAIQRMSVRWPLAHISVERQEVDPFGINGNASTSITLICRRVLVLAAITHVAPRDVFAAAREAVSLILLNAYPDALAAAGRALSVSQIASRAKRLAAAIAVAMPAKSMTMSRFVRCGFTNRQSPETQPSEFNAFAPHMRDFTLLGVN